MPFNGGQTPVPRQVPGLRLWFDASQTSTITSSGGNVSSWGDLSTYRASVTQGTGANQPDTGATTLNGLNVVSFVAANSDNMTLGSSLTLNAGFSCICVYSGMTADATARTLLSQWDSAGNQRGFVFLKNASDNISMQWSPAGTGVGVITLTGPSAVTPGILSFVHTGASGQAFLNGSSIGSAGTALFNSTAAFQLGRTVLGTFMQGNLAEICVYQRQISSAERILIERYLKNKWAISYT